MPLLVSFVLTLGTSEALAITRQWISSTPAPFLWSEPNNWSPTGTPESGDDLAFSGTTTSSNDMSGVMVRSLRFSPSSSTLSILRGLPVTIRGGISGTGSGMGSGNFDVQCQIILDNDQPFSFDGNRLTLSGGIDLNGHHLIVNVSPVSANIFVGPISGAGDIENNGAGTVHWFGANNTFTGTLRVNNGVVQFEKNSGQFAIPTTARLEIAGGAQVRLQAADQIADSSSVVVENGGQLLLNGFHESLSGGLTLWGGAIVDGGNNYSTTALTLASNLTVRATNSPAVIRKGIVDLNSMPRLDIDGSVSPALEISANLSGTGFIKTGGGVLRLSGTNSFTQDAVIEQGEVEPFHISAFGTTDGGVQLNGGSIRLNNFNISGERLVANVGALQSSNDIRQAIFGAGLFVLGTCSWTGPVTLNTNLFVSGNNNNVTMTFSGVISGAAGLLLSSGIFNLSGAGGNTYVGETFITAANLNLSKANAVGGALVLGTGGNDATARCFQHNAIAGNAVRVNEHGLYDLNGFNQSLTELQLRDGGDVTTGAGTLGFSGNSDLFVGTVTTTGSRFTSSINGNLQLPSAATLNVHVRRFSSVAGVIGPEFDIPATISGSGTITKDGGGNMRFAGNNLSAGDVIVNEGALDLNNPAALGDTTFPIIVNGSGTLLLEVLGLSLPGIFFNGKTLILNSSNICALLNINGSNTWNGPIVLNRDSGVCLDDYLNVPTTISGPGGLTMDGTGVLQFSGFSANTYAGRTIVKGGRIDAFRPNRISIPADLTVGDLAQPPYSAELRVLRDRQIDPRANVTLGGNGLLSLLDFPGAQPVVQVRTISGSGLVHIDPGCTLTVSNDLRCRFDGVMEGSGPFNKDGPAIMEWTGTNSSYSGLANVKTGDFLMNGEAPSMDVQVNANAVLRGDGRVGDVVVASQGILGADSKFPDHQGGDLTINLLSLGLNSTLSLEFFGPSPTGGNDQIICGAASIMGANLLPIFHYPPRSGDAILVLIKALGGSSETFNGWPQGTERTFNGIPVHISYTGGNGNDVTLTVTNLALNFFNYTLLEGNGNQTVEPDECNLLFVSLFNRRPSTLRITNAVLRSLTADALVTIPQASYPPITIGNVAANITPFQFRTRSSMICGNSTSFELVLGVANEGEFAVTFSPVSGNDCSTRTGPCESCTVVSGRLDTNALTTLQPINFIGGPSLCFPVKACPGVDTNTALFPEMRYVTHSFTNTATNEICVSAVSGFNCPAFVRPQLAAYLATFNTNDICQNYLGDSGPGGGSAQVPVCSFRVPAGSNFVLVVSTRGNQACVDYTATLFGLPCPPPSIGIGISGGVQIPQFAGQGETSRRGSPKIGISWTTASPGWIAEQASRVDATFTEIPELPAIIDGRYVLTNIPATDTQFYRLKQQ
jgi:autotransporter-associated beta strand protein